MNNTKTSNKRHGNYYLLVGLCIIISLLFLTGCFLKSGTNSTESELPVTASSEIAETEIAAAGSTGSENSPGENTSATDLQGKDNTKDTTTAAEAGEAGQDKDSITDETTAGTNSDGQSSDSTDGTAGQSDLAGSEGQDIKITMKSPEINLQII
jgi:hypothetical protein